MHTIHFLSTEYKVAWVTWYGNFYYNTIAVQLQLYSQIQRMLKRSEMIIEKPLLHLMFTVYVATSKVVNSCLHVLLLQFIKYC